jgi:hypothetical protein
MPPLSIDQTSGGPSRPGFAPSTPARRFRQVRPSADQPADQLWARLPRAEGEPRALGQPQVRLSLSKLTEMLPSGSWVR